MIKININFCVPGCGGGLLHLLADWKYSILQFSSYDPLTSDSIIPCFRNIFNENTFKCRINNRFVFLGSLILSKVQLELLGGSS